MPTLHDWNLTTAEAVVLQRRLADRLILQGSPKSRLVAGIDGSYSRFSPEMWVGIVVWDMITGLPVERVARAGRNPFPYIPGFLTFREGPLILEVFDELKQLPDAVLFDGQGIAHPRGLGLASHLGLWLNLPSVGCAKSRLCGQAEDPPDRIGQWAPLVFEGRTVGASLRSKVHCKPLFVSPGHLIDLETSIALVMACCRGYRLPEPTRLAHLLVNQARRGEL